MLLMYKNTFIFFVDIKVQDDPNCISQSAHCLLTDGQWSV